MDTPPTKTPLDPHVLGLVDGATEITDKFQLFSSLFSHCSLEEF